MKFECKEISISDEEFGCTVTLSENKVENDFGKEKTVDEIMNSFGKFIMIQRTYGEDEFEEDYYYFETSDFGKSGGLDDFKISLTKTEFILTYDKEKYEIKINPSRETFDELKNVLLKITDNKGELHIQ
jgi:hypothetical protein